MYRIKDIYRMYTDFTSKQNRFVFVEFSMQFSVYITSKGLILYPNN